MSDVTSYRVTGDWRHIVDDGMEDLDDLPDETLPTGHVVFTPVAPSVAVAGDPAVAYTLNVITALIAAGELRDLQGRSGVMLAGDIGGQTVRWRAVTHLEYQDKQVPYPDLTFELTSDARLTGLIRNVTPGGKPFIIDPRIEAIAARLDEADQIVAAVAGYAQDAQDQVPLAKAEADRAIGLANAQDEHIAGTLEDPASATHAAFKAVGNATYASQARVGAQPPRPLASPTYATATIAPIEFFDGTLWGVSGREIHKSSDEGATWTLHATAPSGASPVRRLLPCDDGGVLVVGATGVVKATSWATTPVFSSMKVTVNGLARISSFQADGNGTKFIVAEYGPGESSRIDSRYAHISTDMGETWTRAYDAVALQGSAANTSHVHGCCYDPWEDVFYVAEGHTVGSAGLWLSRDDGATWTLYDGYKVDSSPTVLVATDDGLVLGSDDARAGLMGVPRVGPIEDRQVIHTWIWRATNDGVLGFGIQGQRDPETGVVYIGFHTAIPGLPPVIAAGTATSGALVHTHPVGSGASNGDRFASLTLLPSGKVLARAEVGGDGETMSAWRTNVGPSTQDAGGVGGGVAPQNTSIAVGKTNTGSASRSIAAGMGAVVESDSVAVGYESVAPTNSVAVGRGAVSRQGSTVVGYLASASPDGVQDNRNSVAVGYLAKVSGNAAVSIGASATAVIQSIAIGSGASTTGQDAVGIGRGVTAPTNATIVGSGASANDNTVAVGRLASTTGGAAAALGANATAAVSGVAVGAAANAGSSGTALGRNTVASGNNSVAIGRDTVADQAFQVAVGPRDIEVQDAAKGLVLRSPDGTRYRVTVDDAGVVVVGAA